MSKIDEGKLLLLDSLIAIAEYLQNVSNLSLKLRGEMTQVINHFQVVETGTITPQTLGTPVNYWVLTEGPNGPFELLKIMDTEEYRMLRAEVQDKDRPIFHDFGDKNYRIWLMRDNETIGRKPLKAKT
jgi:hypothetical protein